MGETPEILVVDNEETITWAVSQGLSSGGEMSVATAQSGEEALETMLGHEFDLVVTDIRMGDKMNGFELMTQIRELYPTTRIVVLSALGSPEARREATKRGSPSYVGKPFDLDELRQVVRDALEEGKPPGTQTDDDQQGFSGQISNLNLVDMVQLHCHSRDSVMMHVSATGQEGVIGFNDGEVVFASTEAGITGRDAFIDMLGWTGGRFGTEDVSPAEENIDESWEFLLLEASDVISEASDTGGDTAPAAADKAPQEDVGPLDMHSVLEELAVEQGVAAVYLAGDSGQLIDQVTTSYEGDPSDIGELAKGFKTIATIRRVLEPDAAANRTILQFDRNRVLAQEISDTAVYIIVVSSGAGALSRLVEQLHRAASRLATLF